MFEEYSDIMTIDDVCEALMIGRNRCYHLLNDATIQGFRIGSVWKVPKSALINFVNQASISRGQKPHKKINADK